MAKEVIELGIHETPAETEAVGLLKQERQPAEGAKLNAFFLAGGFIFIIGYYCMQSMSPYFVKSYGPQFINVMILFLNIGGLLGFVFYRVSPWRIKIRTMLIYGPMIQSFSVVMALVIGETIQKGSGLKTFLGSIPAFVVGASNSMLHSCFAVLLFDYDHTEMTYNNSGAGIAGVVSTLFPVFQLLFIGSEEYFRQALFYVIFQAMATSMILIGFQLYFSSPKCGVSNTKSMGVELETTKEQIPLIDTFKKIYPIFVSTFLGTTIAISIFPILTFGLGLSPAMSKPLAIQLIILTERSADLVGKVVYTFLPTWSFAVNYIGSLARILLLVVAAYPLTGAGSGATWLVGNTPVTMTIALLHGLSAGYIFASLMHAANHSVGSKQKDNSAFLIILAAFCGLLYGSCCSVAGIEITD